MICQIDEPFNTAPCGFLSFNDDGTIAMLNATLSQLLGYESNQLEGMPIESILPIASRIFYQTHFFPLLKLHGKVEEIYLLLRAKQGGNIPMLVNAVRQERGGSCCNDCILVPMRQRIQYEDELLQAKKVAEAATQAQNQANAALALAQAALEIKQAELLELNVKLEEQVQQRTAQLQQALNFESLLQRITAKVRDSLDERQILQTAVQELGLGLDVEYCDVEVYQADQTRSTIAYASHQTLATAQGWYLDITLTSPWVDVSLLAGEAMQFCPFGPVSAVPHSSQLVVLACPIYDDQGVLGDLWLFRQKEQIFSDLEIRLVQQVANHCAIALRQSRLYREAQMQVQELERLSQLKDDFLNTVSHELRTPMASIKLANQVLEANLKTLGLLADESHAIARSCKIIRDESQREMELINDLLDMARLDADTEPLNLATIDLQLFVPYFVEPFIERTRHQQQHLKINLPENLPLLTTDISYLERILIELLHNACKYSPPGATIALSAQATSAALEIQVSNSGVEIPVAEHERIFSKFYRIPNHDPWKHGGTGLGLALVKKFAERLDIDIRVESSSEKTTFVLEFEAAASTSL
ncbi:ATP-binding protein [Trichocoleus sp. FACHB-591]|uniref:ATP-binding protein n=1 Tax=Trichocoleus sp. FACHB-591 TaxID=2692872 RepID=UPI001689BFC3|nr:ATP-binding protein [Trichocoleus sp. FACHB-591]